MAHHPLQIDLRSLPAEGIDLSGSLPSAIYDLPPDDSVQAAGPLEYDLHVERDGKDLIVYGSLQGEFTLVCGRCLESFPHRVALESYQAELEIPSDTSTMDLTEAVREDMLLTLPSYPRCEDGNVEARECPAEGRFQGESDDETPSQPESQGRAVWDVLDQLPQFRQSKS
jgi:uncharacterized protein